MCWTASIKPNFTDISIVLVFWLSCLYTQNVIGSYRINIFLFFFNLDYKSVLFLESLSDFISLCLCVKGHSGLGAWGGRRVWREYGGFRRQQLQSFGNPPKLPANLQSAVLIQGANRQHTQSSHTCTYQMSATTCSTTTRQNTTNHMHPVSHVLEVWICHQ